MGCNENPLESNAQASSGLGRFLCKDSLLAGLLLPSSTHPPKLTSLLVLSLSRSSSFEMRSFHTALLAAAASLASAQTTVSAQSLVLLSPRPPFKFGKGD